MTWSSGFDPMCALAPLLADVTISVAVRWTLCREAEKHLQENKTKWEGVSASAPWSCVQPGWQDLCTERCTFPLQPQESGGRRMCVEKNVCGDICRLGAALPLHLSKSHRKHQALLWPPSKSTTAQIQIAALTLLAVYALL